jgi:hypothetical protein
MPEPVSLYRPAAEVLPSVYQDDAVSYEQVTGYLSFVDDLLRAYLAALEDVTAWLGPGALGVRPPGLSSGLTAVPEADKDHPQVVAVGELFAELAGWFAFTMPRSWEQLDTAGERDPEATLDRQREFLLRAARIWRERGTPRGFLAWLCFWFELDDEDEIPILIEHFKYRDDHTLGRVGESREDPYAHRVSLLVPLGPFGAHERRRELVQFVARHAPAHLVVRVCWVAEGFEPPPLGDEAAVRQLLTTISSFVEEDDGFHLGKCPLDEAGPRDRLGQGVLPGGGEL